MLKQQIFRVVFLKKYHSLFERDVFCKIIKSKAVFFPIKKRFLKIERLLVRVFAQVFTFAPILDLPNNMTHAIVPIFTGFSCNLSADLGPYVATIFWRQKPASSVFFF